MLARLAHLNTSRFWMRRPLVLLVYIPLFFILLVTANRLALGELSVLEMLLGAWNYEILALLTYCLAVLWERIRRAFIQRAEDTFEFVLKYLASAILGVLFGIELIQLLGSEFLVKPLLLELPHHIPSKFPPILIPSVFLLFVIAGFRSALLQNTRRAEFERMYQETRLLALKVQFNPHFLFNALNLISTEIEEAPQEAVKSLDELAELFRGVLAASNQERIPLAQEFEMIGHYFGIQERRFSPNIQTSLRLPDHCRSVEIPPLLLQPLVENAFIHGFELSGRPGFIRVQAELTEHHLLLRVEDSGQGFEPKPERFHLGVGYVREVLELYYGGKAYLEIDSTPGQGTVCHIWMPREEA